MNVVDSSGWLEYFIEGPNAKTFYGPIKDVASLVVPTITIVEVYKRILGERDEKEALRAIGPMLRGRVADLNPDTAIEAARIGVALGLPLADSVILATARRYDAVLWTQDAHFRGMDQVRYVPAKTGK